MERRLAAGRRHSWRLAVPGAQEPGAFVAFDDLVYGAQSFNVGRELGDVILRRSDGLYAYQFVVTVDDLLMGVSDVVRGRDLLRSTALQIWLRGQMLRTGLGSHNLPAADPQYAHVPLLDNAAGVRLAKRERSLDLGRLREAGVRPDQVIGYCAWHMGLCEGVLERPEAMSAQQALNLFSWRKVRRHAGDVVVPGNIVEVLRAL